MGKCSTFLAVSGGATRSGRRQKGMQAGIDHRGAYVVRAGT